MLPGALIPVDQARAHQFRWLGSAWRPFDQFAIHTDDDGVVWAVKRVNQFGIGYTWLGPGWVFDPYAQQRCHEELACKRREMAVATRSQHWSLLNEVRAQFSIGKHAERLLWFIHQSIWSRRRSVLRFPDYMLADVLWGPNANRPSHWRDVLLRVLRGLSWLHLADWPEAEPSAMGEETALILHAGDLRGHPDDLCGEDCPGHLGPRHHHYMINVGRGFLGVLEQFADADDGIGERTYTFIRGGPRTRGSCLWRTGKTGQLVPVFLPAKLGDPSVCNSFSSTQHRLLQAIVRESTRARRPQRTDLAEPEVIQGNLVPDFHGKKCFACGFLDKDVGHVSFSGNGKRKGLGYLLTSPGGWLAKAGYALADVHGFLRDLSKLADRLQLKVVGINRKKECLGLPAMCGLVETERGRKILADVHLRIYTAADFLERWTTYFCRHPPQSSLGQASRVEDPVARLLADLKSRGLSRRALAKGLGVDHSFLNKVVGGRKGWPDGLLKRAVAWVARQKPPPNKRLLRKPKAYTSESVMQAALSFAERGWSIVPQLPGEKKPCVKWKHFQEVCPTSNQLTAWFRQWPDAGLALILGPVSGTFVIDVDGPEAHAALLQQLGSEPIAPKAISGSRKPFRYHLFFQHPDMPTKAKTTPWHPDLEFRGQGGIVVIPPSLHKSGNRYAWVPGQSPDDLPFPVVPSAVLNALQPVPVRRHTPERRGSMRAVPVGVTASKRTMAFLSGQYADGPHWNERLFNAACDLCGRGLPFEEAESLLLGGARPWNRGEEELARRTILSAYSRPREPASY